MKNRAYSPAHTAPDLPPVAGKHARVARIMNTNAAGRFRFWRRSICMTDMWWRGWSRGIAVGNSWPCFKDLDAYYPPEATLRVILDNPFGPTFQRNPRLFGNAAQPVPVCCIPQNTVLG